MRRWIFVTLAALLAACSSADDVARPKQQHQTTARGGDVASGADPLAPPDATPAPGPPPRKPPRVDLASLPEAEQQRIFDAIDGWIHTARVAVKIRGTDVVPWENAFDRIAPVSVVRAHYAVHHAGEHFFTCHRWYIGTLEAALADVLPNGRLPTWRPDTPMPAAFSQLAPPSKAAADCLTLGNVMVACEFAFTNSYRNVHGASVTVKGFESTNPRVALPTRYEPQNICSFDSATSLALDIGAGITRTPGYHNMVHNTIGGTMQSMDSPAAAIFWPWHAFVDDIFQSWLDCGLSPPPACPVDAR
jgi:hypothetical protein